MHINITFDSSVNGAPAGFTAAVNTAVQFFESHFFDPITINISIGYGEVGGQALSQGALGESLTFLNSYTYAQIRNALIADGRSAVDMSAIASLPGVNPTGNGTFWVTTAEAKALGLAGPSSSLDGEIGFSSSFPFAYDPNNRAVAGAYDFIGTVEHEISEVMGRILLAGETIGPTPNSYGPYDLFHFSAAGTHIFSGTQAGYFSVDNGTTHLLSFNTNPNGDFGDWAASAGHDAALAFSSSGVMNVFSQTDIWAMDVLGWDVQVQQLLTVAGTGHFNNDAMSDILFFHDGTLATWLMNGANGTTRNVVYSGFGSGWQVVGGGDFNNDGNSDILFLNTSGTVAMWEMNGSQILGGFFLPSAPGGWHVAGVGDFNNDHMSDILLLNNNGTFAMWEMNGSQVQVGALLPSAPGGWQVAGVGDFNGDHMSDILLFLPNGALALWEMNGTQVQAGAMLPSLDSSWRLPAVGDFNNDGLSDIVLQNVNGTVAIWEMNGFQIQSSAVVGSMSSAWHIAGVADFNGDHMSDILWQNDSGALQIWQMNGLTVTPLTVVPPAGAPPGGAFPVPQATASDLDAWFAIPDAQSAVARGAADLHPTAADDLRIGLSSMHVHDLI